MSQDVISIQFTGAVNNPQSDQSAPDTISALFKIPAAKAQQLIDRAPVTIKKGLTEESAQRYAKTLDKYGIGYQIIGLKEDLQAISERAKKAVGEDSAASMTEQTPEDSAETASVPTYKGLAFDSVGKPDYGFVTVQIPADETIKVEASAMATMDTHLVMKTKARGGLSRLMTRESIFINEFTAQSGPGEIGIAPGAPGDIGHVHLDDDIIYLQNSAFVAATMGVEVESKWQGLTKGFFSGESLFLIRCSGQGDLWFNTYGGMLEIDVADEYIVDTGNIVAFTDGLEYNINAVGGYKSLFFSGEGLVCRFTGKGKVWIQTRGVQAFSAWANPYRPVKKGKLSRLFSIFSSD